MIIFAFLISLLLGHAVLRAVCRDKCSLSWELDLAFSFGIGITASALLTFLCLLVFGGFNHTAILLSNLAALIVLATAGPKKSIFPADAKISFSTIALNLLTILPWIVFFFVIAEMSRSHPFGQWDAWAVWNMKAKFIIYGGKSWLNVFQLHWHTQPDYPLLLPMILSWVHAVSGADLNAIAMLTARLFTLATGFLLFAALKRSLPVAVALLAGLAMVTNRFYLFMGTAQYADIILAFYLLSSCSAILYGLRDKNTSLTFLAGIFLGILCFTKNEGIIMAGILLAVQVLSLCFDRTYIDRRRQLTKNLLTGFACSAWAALILKLFLTPANRDISVDTFSKLPQLFSMDRVGMILEYFSRVIVDPFWHYIWIAILILTALSVAKFRHNELRGFILFFILYLGTVGIVYLTTMNFDLFWRLQRTAPRVLFCLMPASLFISLYAVWRQNKGIISQ